MPQISARGQEMPESPIRKLAPLADDAKKRGVHVYHLNIGQPDLPTPKSALEAIRNIDRTILEYSPSQGYLSYRKKLVGYYASYNINLSPDDIIITSGGSEAVLFSFLACLNPGDEIIVPEPAYANYMAFAISAGAKIRTISTTIEEGFSLPKVEKFEELINEHTRAILICNPNNPTGGMFTEEQQQAFLKAIPDNVLVVIDEAYFEYGCENSDFPKSMELLKTRKNILILRTFSKIYGLAGLRVGYGIADSALISELEKTRPPFNVCSPALAAAEAALFDREFVAQSLVANREGKAFLEKSFDDMGLTYIKSSTNFIAVNTGHDAKTVYEKLLKLGFIVKGGHVLGMPGYLRVSIGTLAECQAFVKALQQVLQSF